MRVLVTRPQPGARRTAEKLAALGHEAVEMPLTRAVHHPQAAIAALSQSFAAIAVTSREAAAVLARPDVAPLVPPASRFFAVGEATAAALRALGHDAIDVSGGNATDLAALIATGWPAGETRPVVYLAGTPRTGTLESGLEAANVPCRIATCYTMEVIDRGIDEQMRLLDDPPPEAVLFYSREAARIFFAQQSLVRHPRLAGEAYLVCMSAAIAGAIPQTASKNIIIAAAPDEAALLAALPG